MQRLHVALKPLATSYAATLCSILLTLVITPLYVRHLGLAQMGLLAVGQAIAGYLVLAQGGLSTSTMILVSHAKGRDDQLGIARVLRHSLVLSAAAVSLVGVLTPLLIASIVAWPELQHALHLDHPEIPYVIAAIGVQVMVSLAFSSFYDLLAGQQENDRALRFQAANRIFSQIVGAAAGIRVGTASAVIVGGTSVAVCVGLLCVADTWRRHPAAFRKTPIESRELLAQVRMSLKSFSIQVGATMNGFAPVVALNQFAGPATVPYFTLPNQIISLVTGVIGTFGGFMLPVFGEAWAKGDLAWIQETVTKLFEKALLLLAAMSAGFIALAGPFLQSWVHLEIPVLMLISVALIGVGTNIISYLKFMLSGINRHRGAAISELANGALAVVLAVAACRFSINAVGLGIAAAGALTSYWFLPREIRRHLGIARVMPSAQKLVVIAAVAGLVFATAKLGFLLLHRVLHAPALVAVLIAAVLGSLAFLKASSASGIFDWHAIFARFRKAPDQNSV